MGVRSATQRGLDRHRLRPRNTIIAFLVAWITAQLGLVAFIERDSWLRDPLYADKEVKLRQRVVERSTPDGRPTTVVVIGSSRVNMAVRGEPMERAIESNTSRRAVAFNFGVPAAGPIANLLAVRRLVASEVRPDMIVLEVLPPLLARHDIRSYDPGMLMPERLLFGEQFLADESELPRDDMRLRWWTAELVPWYGFRFQLLGRLCWTWRPWNLRFTNSRDGDANGWTPTQVESVTALEYRSGVEQAFREYGASLIELHCQGPAADAVEESIAQCQSHGVRISLLLMPEGSDFRSFYSPQAEAETYRFLAELHRKYGVGVIDARQWQADGDFKDSHHLLPDGADRFSERLGREVGALLQRP